MCSSVVRPRFDLCVKVKGAAAASHGVSSSQRPPICSLGDGALCLVCRLSSIVYALFVRSILYHTTTVYESGWSEGLVRQCRRRYRRGRWVVPPGDGPRSSRRGPNRQKAQSQRKPKPKPKRLVSSLSTTYLHPDPGPPVSSRAARWSLLQPSRRRRPLCEWDSRAGGTVARRFALQISSGSQLVCNRIRSRTAQPAYFCLLCQSSQCQCQCQSQRQPACHRYVRSTLHAFSTAAARGSRSTGTQSSASQSSQVGLPSSTNDPTAATSSCLLPVHHSSRSIRQSVRYGTVRCMGIA